MAESMGCLTLLLPAPTKSSKSISGCRLAYSMACTTNSNLSKSLVNWASGLLSAAYSRHLSSHRPPSTVIKSIKIEWIESNQTNQIELNEMYKILIKLMVLLESIPPLLVVEHRANMLVMVEKALVSKAAFSSSPTPQSGVRSPVMASAMS